MRPAWLAGLALLGACAGTQGPDTGVTHPVAGASPDKLMVVDCLLPGIVINQGQFHTWMTPPQPLRTSAQECEIRGGEYVSYDRANLATALKVWKETADGGDAAAQTYVGEIYEKGLGVPSDPALAASWYQKTADQGYARALTNLAYLYEKGLGVEKDPRKAVKLYRRAVGLPDTVALTVGAPSEELRASRQELESTHRKLQDTQAELAKVRTSAAQKEQETKRLQEQLETLRKDTGGNQTTLRQLQDELKRSQEGIDRFQAQAAAAEERAKQYQQTVKRLEEKTSPPSTPAAPAGVDFGTYYAVVIGNQNYQNHAVLKTSLNDAKAVAEVLEKKYRFKTKLFLDANYTTMMKALFDAANQLGENDNLLLYFAGHGQLRKDISRGYWLPIDAGKELDGTWVSTGQINDTLAISKARHILVVVDSCFAGALVRGAEEIPMPANREDATATTAWIRQLAKAKSRKALTSGGLTPVVDTDGRAKNSIFADALLDVLGNNSEVLSGYAVWEKVSPRVTGAASRLMNDPQKPEYNAMFGVGHDSGEFFFSPVARRAAADPRLVAESRQLAAP